MRLNHRIFIYPFCFLLKRRIFFLSTTREEEKIGTNQIGKDWNKSNWISLSRNKLTNWRKTILISFKNVLFPQSVFCQLVFLWTICVIVIVKINSLAYVLECDDCRDKYNYAGFESQFLIGRYLTHKDNFKFKNGIIIIG